MIPLQHRLLSFTSTVLLALSLAPCARCADSDDKQADAARPLDAAAHASDARQPPPDGTNAEEDSGTSVEPSWLPLTPDQTLADRALSTWISQWAIWHLSFDDCVDNPYYDVTGEACGQQQLADPKAVFFLEGGEYPSSRSDCVIPHGHALLVPMTSYIADGQMLATNQKRVSMPEAAYAEMIALSVRDLRLEIDGYPVKDLTPWIAQPVPFTTTIAPAPNYFSCAGSVDFEGDLHGYVVGAFVLLPAPTAGQHTLRYGGTFSVDGYDVVTDVTTALTIR